MSYKYLKRLSIMVMIFFIAARIGGEEKTAVAGKSPCRKFSPLVSIKPGFISPDDPHLKRFMARHGMETIIQTSYNPICCTRIERLSVDKNMTGEQFVMIHYGYNLIQVTSSKALELLDATLQKINSCDSNSLPEGVLTSFNIISTNR